MALNPYIGKSQTWLEARLSEVQTQRASAFKLTSGSAGEASFGYTQVQNIDKVISELLQALHLLDPLKYPASSISRNSRTLARF